MEWKEKQSSQAAFKIFKRFWLAKKEARLSAFLLSAVLTLAGGFQANAGESPAFTLRPSAAVSGEGIYLHDLVESREELPQILLSPAPAFGRSTNLTAAQVTELLLKKAPDMAAFGLQGAEAVKVSRKSRTLEESEIRTLLLDLLQREHVRERGELELRLTRAWQPIPVPDEPFEIQVVDLPASGISPYFIARFEIKTARETVGTWPIGLQARVMKEIWIARSTISRRQTLADCDLALEKRDVLGLRETLAVIDPSDSSLEVNESVAAGTPLYARAVRPRPVVHRGKIVDALVEDGSMVISAKVEVMEEGIPGQLVRVRNLKSKKEFRGKVQNEQTVVVSL